MKKYEKEEFAKEKTYFYKMLSDALKENLETAKSLEEVSKILWTLSMADLKSTDVCLRSLKANHKEFNYIATKYSGDKIFAGKQMKSILTHLEKFNDDLIKYLEEVKLYEKEKHKPDNTKHIAEKYELQIKNLEKQIEEEKRKAAILYNENEKKKFKIENLEKDVGELEIMKKNIKEFDHRLSNIVTKINDGKDWDKEFEHLRKDKFFSKERPFCVIMNFEELFHIAFGHKIEKEVERLCKIFQDLSNIFRRKKYSHEKRFQEIAKILEAPGKKDPHLYELHRHLEGLMFTIIGKTKEDAEEERLKRLEREKKNV